MLVQKGFKFRLAPTKEQKQKLLQHGGNARFVWNYFLKINIDYYKETSKFKFYNELAVFLPKLKKEYPFLKESFSQSLQMVARQFDKALKDSFTKEKGFPSFKKKNLLNDSFTCPQKWRLGKGFVFIPKIGEVKWIKHRAMQGKPKSITISQDGDRWYCSVLCEYDIEEQEKKTDNIVGIDVGLKEFATLSDGTAVGNPKHLKKYEEKLVSKQRRLNKKQKGSKNRFKQRIKVKIIHTKIKNLRQDFLHKTTSDMITKYDGVVLEDLNVKGMMKNHLLAKSIADVSWSEFTRQLEYKAKWNFKYFILIERFEPTSKTCSNCGHIQDMPLSKRQFNCPDCGISIDRDLNASINICRLGQSRINACGVGSKEPTLKQEKECLVN
ncbi:IS200/IS605 family transposase ISMac7 [subsurface metagenome]